MIHDSKNEWVLKSLWELVHFRVIVEVSAKSRKWNWSISMKNKTGLSTHGWCDQHLASWKDQFSRFSISQHALTKQHSASSSNSIVGSWKLWNDTLWCCQKSWVQPIKCPLPPLSRQYQATYSVSEHPRSGQPRVMTPGQNWIIVLGHLRNHQFVVPHIFLACVIPFISAILFVALRSCPLHWNALMSSSHMTIHFSPLLVNWIPQTLPMSSSLGIRTPSSLHTGDHSEFRDVTRGCLRRMFLVLPSGFLSITSRLLFGYTDSDNCVVTHAGLARKGPFFSKVGGWL